MCFNLVIALLATSEMNESSDVFAKFYIDSITCAVVVSLLPELISYHYDSFP